MSNYDPASYFGPEAARRYDAHHERGDEADAARLLAELAGEGPALEFAIGTGRIALPLAACGVAVHGIELSRILIFLKHWEISNPDECQLIPIFFILSKIWLVGSVLLHSFGVCESRERLRDFFLWCHFFD